jgi:hypothetical protein
MIIEIFISDFKSELVSFNEDANINCESNNSTGNSEYYRDGIDSDSDNCLTMLGGPKKIRNHAYARKKKLGIYSLI